MRLDLSLSRFHVQFAVTETLPIPLSYFVARATLVCRATGAYAHVALCAHQIKSPSTSCLGKIQGFFTMSVNNPRGNISDRCQVCSFVFINIKRKRNLNGEFMKIFEVFNRKVLPDYGLPRGVCDTCHGTNIISWKRNCNWEVTDSKENWYAFVMAAVEKD